MLDLKSKITQIKDWPKKGAIYTDISDIFLDAQSFKYVIKELAEFYKNKKIDYVAGIEARGFMVSSALAYELGVGAIMIRKKAKQPPPIIFQEYTYEYSSSIVVMRKDALKQGQRIVLVDDILATGCTMEASISLIKRLKAEVVGISFVVEKEDLKGRDKFKKYKINSVVKI